MFFILGWLIGSLLLGGLAHNWKGHDGLKWGIMAALFSPLLMFVILLLVPNLKEKKIADFNAQKFNLERFQEELQAVKDLHSKGVYSDDEYQSRYKEIISAAKSKVFIGSPEKYIGEIASLIDTNLITKEDFNLLKTVIVQSYRHSDVS